MVVGRSYSHSVDCREVMMKGLVACGQQFVWRKPVLVACAIVYALLGIQGCADVIPFSSGALEGTVVANPVDWTPVGEPNIIQLETQGEKPYSVNLWISGLLARATSSMCLPATIAQPGSSTWKPTPTCGCSVVAICMS